MNVPTPAAAAVVGVATWLLVWLLTRLAPAIGLVDEPDGELKHHARPVPVSGGIAVFIGIHLGSMLTGGLDAGLVGATTLLLAVGLVDDLRTMSPRLRLAAEAGAGLVLGLFGDLSLSGPAGVAAAVLLVLVATNAVNLLDGADGVAGSAAAVSAIGLAAIALGRSADPAIAVVTAAAVAGFLLMNWPPARAYLGDGGAYVLGGTLSALVLSADSNPATTGAAVAAALVAGGTLGIFLVDLAVTLLRRRAAGAPLLIGDRSHLYDQLADRGWRPGQVAAAVGAVQLCFAALALGADRLLGGWPAVLAVTAGFALVLAALWRAGFVVARAG